MAIYYVSPSLGSDTNDGLSSTTPWQTFAKCLAIGLNNNTFYFSTGVLDAVSATGCENFTLDFSFPADHIGEKSPAASCPSFVLNNCNNITINNITVVEGSLRLYSCQGVTGYNLSSYNAVGSITGEVDGAIVLEHCTGVNITKFGAYRASPGTATYMCGLLVVDSEGTIGYDSYAFSNSIGALVMNSNSGSATNPTVIHDVVAAKNTYFGIVAANVNPNAAIDITSCTAAETLGFTLPDSFFGPVSSSEVLVLQPVVSPQTVGAIHIIDTLGYGPLAVPFSSNLIQEKSLYADYNNWFPTTTFPITETITPSGREAFYTLASWSAYSGCDFRSFSIDPCLPLSPAMDYRFSFLSPTYNSGTPTNTNTVGDSLFTPIGAMLSEVYRTHILYVTITGNDSNDGLTETTALATIAAAMAKVGSDSVLLYLGAGLVDILTLAGTRTIVLYGYNAGVDNQPVISVTAPVIDQTTIVFANNILFNASFICFANLLLYGCGNTTTAISELETVSNETFIVNSNISGAATILHPLRLGISNTYIGNPYVTYGGRHEYAYISSSPMLDISIYAAASFNSDADSVPEDERSSYFLLDVENCLFTDGNVIFGLDPNLSTIFAPIRAALGLIPDMTQRHYNSVSANNVHINSCNNIVEDGLITTPAAFLISYPTIGFVSKVTSESNVYYHNDYTLSPITVVSVAGTDMTLAQFKSTYTGYEISSVYGDPKIKFDSVGNGPYYSLRKGSAALRAVANKQFTPTYDYYGTLLGQLPLNAGLYTGPAISILPDIYTGTVERNQVDTVFLYSVDADFSVPVLAGGNPYTLDNETWTVVSPNVTLYDEQQVYAASSGAVGASVTLPIQLMENDYLFVTVSVLSTDSKLTIGVQTISGVISIGMTISYVGSHWVLKQIGGAGQITLTTPAPWTVGVLVQHSSIIGGLVSDGALSSYITLHSSVPSGLNLILSLVSTDLTPVTCAVYPVSPVMLPDELRSTVDLRATAEIFGGSLSYSTVGDPTIYSGYASIVPTIPFSASGTINSATICIASPPPSVHSSISIYTAQLNGTDFIPTALIYSGTPILGVNNISFAPVDVVSGTYIIVYTNAIISVVPTVDPLIGLYWSSTEPQLLQPLQTAILYGLEACIYLSDRPLVMASYSRLLSSTINANTPIVGSLCLLGTTCAIDDLTISTSPDNSTWTSVTPQILIDPSFRRSVSGSTICSVDQTGLYVVNQYHLESPAVPAHCELSVNNPNGARIQARQLRLVSGCLTTVSAISDWVALTTGDNYIPLLPTVMDPKDFLAFAIVVGDTGACEFLSIVTELLSATCLMWTADVESASLSMIAMTMGTNNTTLSLDTYLVISIIAQWSTAAQYVRFAMQEGVAAYTIFVSASIFLATDSIAYGVNGTFPSNMTTDDTAGDWLGLKFANNSTSATSTAIVAIVPDGRKLATKYTEISYDKATPTRHCENNLLTSCAVSNPRFLPGINGESKDCCAVCPQYQPGIVLMAIPIPGGTYILSPAIQQIFAVPIPVMGLDIEADSYTESEVNL